MLINPRREFIQDAPYYFKYHFFVVVYKDDGMLLEPYSLGIQWVGFLHNAPFIFFHNPTHLPPECEFHVLSIVVFPVPRTVLGILKLLKKYVLNQCTEYYLPPSPKGGPKGEAGFDEREDRSRSKIVYLQF